MRAERRLGEMIRKQKETVGLNRGLAGSRLSGSRQEPVRDERPTLAEQNVDKKLSSRSQKLEALPLTEFEERIAQTQKEVRAAAQLTRAERAAEKKERRAEREAELGKRQKALPTKRYGVLYVDPPWRFEVWSRETGLGNTSPDNHYPTLTIDQIRALDVPSADDCVLFLWSTVPHESHAHEVMSAWGFTYMTSPIWVKTNADGSLDLGTGYWFRDAHEVLLVGTKGNVPAPAPGTQFPSVVFAPVGAHSEKPAIFRKMIETMFPSLPKLEMYVRGGPFEGWDLFGNEASPNEE